jgi:hypothetical protein
MSSNAEKATLKSGCLTIIGNVLHRIIILPKKRQGISLHDNLKSNEKRLELRHFEPDDRLMLSMPGDLTGDSKRK